MEYEGYIMPVIKVEENFYRRKAARLGVFLSRSSAKLWHIDNQQGYRIIDKSTSRVLAGQKYDLSFEDAKAFLDEYEIKLKSAK